MAKSDRKSKRVSEKVKREHGIETVSDRNSCNLLVCNAGLMNGWTKEGLVETLLDGQKDIKLAKMVMIPGKSYSFATFCSVEEAQRAFDNAHGKDKESPLYLAFVDSVPNVSDLDDSFEYQEMPPGLRVIEDFISQEEEKQILDSIRWDDANEDSYDLKHRQVMHFGFDFNYSDNSIDSNAPNNRPFPELWMIILNRALTSGAVRVLPDQCTVNRYLPGQGIPPHVDSHTCCDDSIASLSLESDVVMTFTNPDNNQQIPVLLPRLSLAVMSGKARYVYRHAIPSRLSDIVLSEEKQGLTLLKRGIRTSLTFRKTIPNAHCECAFANHCDYQKRMKERQQSLQLDELAARNLEQLHVHSVYEEIADHFSETRHTPWPRVTEFISSLNPHSVLIDVGCGNGKYLGQHPDQLQIGCDYSQGLVSICQQRGFNGVRCDCLRLPFKSNCASGVICIAVIHHLATQDRRLQSVREMIRVLQPGGRGLIYAWAKDQKRNEKPSSYLKQKKKSVDTSVNENNLVSSSNGQVQLPVHKNRTDFKHSDLFVPWKKKQQQEEVVLHRFYHVFEEGELENLVLSVSGAEIESSYYDQGNWCVIFKKVSC